MSLKPGHIITLNSLQCGLYVNMTSDTFIISVAVLWYHEKKMFTFFHLLYNYEGEV